MQLKKLFYQNIVDFKTLRRWRARIDAKIYFDA